MKIIQVKLYVRITSRGALKKCCFTTVRKMANCSEPPVLAKQGIFQYAILLAHIF